MTTELSRMPRCSMHKADKSLGLEDTATSGLPRIFQALRMFTEEKFPSLRLKLPHNSGNTLIRNISETLRRIIRSCCRKRNGRRRPRRKKTWFVGWSKTRKKSSSTSRERSIPLMSWSNMWMILRTSKLSYRSRSSCKRWHLLWRKVKNDLNLLMIIIKVFSKA